MNDEKYSTERSSKAEKFKRKKEGCKINNNNNQSKNKNYENNEDLCFSKYYDKNKTSNASHDLISAINMNHINEDIMKNKYICNGSFQNAYPFTEDSRNLSDNVNRNLCSNQVHANNHESIHNNDENSYNNNFSSSLIKLININCNNYQEHNCNSVNNNQGIYNNTRLNVNEATIDANKNYDDMNDSKRNKSNIEKTNNEINNILGDSCFMNKLKILQEGTCKSRENNITNNLNDTRDTYDNCLFEKSIKKKKKRNFKDKKSNEYNNTSNPNNNNDNNNININNVLYNLNINNQNCTNISAHEIDNSPNKNKNFMNNNITKNILDNMNYLCSLNKNVENNNNNIQMLNKNSNLNYMKNIIRDMNKLQKIHNNSSNNKNNIILKNNDIDQSAPQSENNNYINFLDINKLSKEDPINSFRNPDNIYLQNFNINSKNSNNNGNGNNKNNNIMNYKDTSTLYKTSDYNAINNQVNDANDAIANNIFVLPLKSNIDTNDKYAQNMNKTPSSNNMHGKILASEDCMKMKSPLHTYECYNCSCKNCTDNTIDLNKTQVSRGKILNLNQMTSSGSNKDTGNSININNYKNGYASDENSIINNNKLQNLDNTPLLNTCKITNQNKKKNMIDIINENSSEINSCQNNIRIVNKKVSTKYKNEEKGNSEIYEDSNNHSNEQEMYKGISINANIANSFTNKYSPNYKTSMKKKKNDEKDNSMNKITSVNKIITNICEMLQSDISENKNNKNFENILDTKLVNTNYHEKNSSINNNDNNSNRNDYTESAENVNYNLFYKKNDGIYNYMNSSKKNANNIFSALEKQSKKKLKNNDTLLLLKNLSLNDRFSCLKNIQEQFDCLRQNDETFKTTNFFSDAHVETNVDDPIIYSKKNQGVNFHIEETINYEIDKAENEEPKENENIKKTESVYAECEKGKEDQEGCKEKEYKINGDKYKRKNSNVEGKKINEDFNENYQKSKINLKDENCEEESEENDEEKEQEESDESELYEECNEYSNEETKGKKTKINAKAFNEKNKKRVEMKIKKKIKKVVSKKNLLKNNGGECKKNKKNIHDYHSTKNKSNSYLNHCDEINRAIININNSNIDQFTKEKLLQMIKEPFFSDDNRKIHLFYEDRKDAHNGKDNQYVDTTNKNENENSNNFDNINKNKDNILKYSMNMFNYDEALKESKKKNSKEFSEKNDIQQIIQTRKEGKFFNDSSYVYENQSYREETEKNTHENNQREKEIKNRKLKRNSELEKEKMKDEEGKESSNEKLGDYSNERKFTEKKNNNEKGNFHINTIIDISKNDKVNDNEDNKGIKKKIKMNSDYNKKLEEKDNDTTFQMSHILSNGGDQSSIIQKDKNEILISHINMIDKENKKEENFTIFNKKKNSTDVEKSNNQRYDSEDEENGLCNEMEDYEESNCYETCGIQKCNLDGMHNKKFNTTLNNEKKRKTPFYDITKGNDLKKINDNCFKLHSNLASNLLSTSTSSSYSNDNVKAHVNNFEMNHLSSNTCMNKFILEEEMHNNLNMNIMLNKNYSLYDINKKNTDERNLENIDTNSTNNEFNISEKNNDFNNDEDIIKNKEGILNEICKYIIKKDVETKNVCNNNTLLKSKYTNTESANNNESMEKDKVKNKSIGNYEIINKVENNFDSSSLNKNNTSSQSFQNDHVVLSKDNNVWNTLSKQNEETVNSYGEIKMDVNKYDNLRLRKKMLFKDKSYSDNDNSKNCDLKRRVSSSSDSKGSYLCVLKKNEELQKDYIKEKEEFLLNRASSLNLSTTNDNTLDNSNNSKNGNDNNNNIIGVKREKEIDDNIVNNTELQKESSSIQIESISKELNENKTVSIEENENMENNKIEKTNEIPDATDSTAKVEIDKQICTLANCPTHNPQNHAKHLAKKNDSQGDSGIVKEENDELKRIPGVYYDKNSQRWFGEHKINGVKCAQSFAVKKHGCEEAKRLAIEWKKARIRGEVWDRFINKKKKNNSNNCLKSPKSNRPSVEELRMKYLSMSKNMPKVRGVWFNSTPQRMGWVGQAYKKCKRIERIFSVNKYGFEGARKLAIAFRNSQKPSNEDSDEDNWSKDDKMNIKNSEDNLNNYEYKNNFLSSINNIKNNNKIESKDIRINLCRDAILFILQDLETILELNIPLLNKNVNIYKLCIKQHLNYLTLINNEEQIIPYLTVFGDYIQRCILPTDLPYAELYVLIDSLIHNETLPSFDHKQNFSEYSTAEDTGIITPSMLL